MTLGLNKSNNITVVGSGYVGMSLAVLLSQKNNVTILDIDIERVKKINLGESPIRDKTIEKFLSTKNLLLKATSNKKEAYENTDAVLVATPTDYSSELKAFDTENVDSVVDDIFNINRECLIVIKSTLPIGHVQKLQEKYGSANIIFSPEFLREGKALDDNLNPSRIVIGSQCKTAKIFGEILKKTAEKEDVEIIYSSSSEAEAIKLFSNTYLALRVSFFNELDSFALKHELDSRKIIQGVSLDGRIGNYYNNPSFGYGGYCLPKDTKQLLSNFDNLPQNVISATIESNRTRKDLIAKYIKDQKPDCVGIYKLAMKSESDNFRSSSILGIIERLLSSNIKVAIYEPSINKSIFKDAELVKDIEEFKRACDLIVTNRIDKNLVDIQEKVFTRDIFGSN